MEPDAKEDGQYDTKLERRTVSKLDLILVPAMRYAEGIVQSLGTVR